MISGSLEVSAIEPEDAGNELVPLMRIRAGAFTNPLLLFTSHQLPFLQVVYLLMVVMSVANSFASTLMKTR